MAFADRSSHLTRKVKVWKTSLWGTNQDHVEDDSDTMPILMWCDRYASAVDGCINLRQ